MATEFQVQFVENIEASMRALAVQDRTAPTISSIMEDAGYDAVGLFAIVNRLKENGEKDLLSRLRSAFEYARKMPRCLMDVKPSLEPLVISLPTDKGLPVPEPERAFSGLENAAQLPYIVPKKPDIPTTASSMHSPPSDDEAEVLAQVISMLRPLKHMGRTRILGATSMFYGVGE